MREDERGRTAGGEPRGKPAEPAKVHGDVLDDLIPRDLREEGASTADPKSESDPTSDPTSESARLRRTTDDNER